MQSVVFQRLIICSQKNNEVLSTNCADLMCVFSLFLLQFSSKSIWSAIAITCICLYATATALYSAATTSDVSANVPPGARQRTSSICSYAQQKRFHSKWWRTQTNSNTKCVSSLTFDAIHCLFCFLFGICLSLIASFCLYLHVYYYLYLQTGTHARKRTLCQIADRLILRLCPFGVLSRYNYFGSYFWHRHLNPVQLD